MSSSHCMLLDRSLLTVCSAYVNAWNAALISLSSQVRCLGAAQRGRVGENVVHGFMVIVANHLCCKHICLMQINRSTSRRNKVYREMVCRKCGAAIWSSKLSFMFACFRANYMIMVPGKLLPYIPWRAVEGSVLDSSYVRAAL